MPTRWVSITATKVRQHTLCERLPFMDVHGPRERAQPANSLHFQLDYGRREEARILAARDAPRVTNTGVVDRPFREQARWTLAQMRSGVPEIEQGVLLSDNWSGRPDILQRVEGQSSFGPWMYRPVDAKCGSKKWPVATKRVPVAFYALLLGKVQGAQPSTFVTDHYDGANEECTADYIDRVHAAVTGIVRAERGEDPGLRMTSRCRDCKWHTVCREDAERTNHITLLPGLRRDSAAALLRRGIESVADVVAQPTFLPSVQGIGTERSASRLAAHARAYVERAPQVIGVHDLPERRRVEAFIDFEGLGQNNSTDAFLFGLLIRKGTRIRYRHWFGRDGGYDEAWSAFTAAVRGLPRGTTLFHFGGYERQIVSGMGRRTRVGRNLPARLVDVYATSRRSVAFPTKGFGLKHIAPALGFKARHQEVDGSVAPQLWSRWLVSRDVAVKRVLREYNEDDLRALLLLVDWVREHVPSARMIRSAAP
jgi:predicted RecB family nuclease